MSEPFWAVEPLPPPARPIPRRAGVVVVGGGITGASLMHHLGPDAVLFERAGHLASGASGRNAGFLLAGVASNYAEAVALYGREIANHVWGMTAENHDRLLEALGGDARLYARSGSWTLAESPSEAESLREAAEMLREDGFAAEFVERPPGVLGLFAGGVLNTNDGELDPAAAVRRLAAPHLDRVYPHTEVVGVETGRVHLAGGAVCEAHAVVLATNAYTSTLVPALPITPTRGQMLAATTVSAATDRPTYSHRGYNYWRQVGPTALMGGYRDRFPDEEVTLAAEPTLPVQALLQEHLDRLGCRPAVTHRWAGVMGFSPDGLPMVGEVPGMAGVHVCGGYTGHGLGFAFTCAEILARSLRTGAPPPGWMDARRFAGE